MRSPKMSVSLHSAPLRHADRRAGPAARLPDRSRKQAKSIIPRAVLYHVTHVNNLRAIACHGLRINRDRRGRGRVWLCDRKRIGWAVLHVTEAHRWEPWEIAIVGVTHANPFRSGREGIMYVRADVQPSCICLCVSTIQE